MQRHVSKRPRKDTRDDIDTQLAAARAVTMVPGTQSQIATASNGATFSVYYISSTPIVVMTSINAATPDLSSPDVQTRWVELRLTECYKSAPGGLEHIPHGVQLDLRRMIVTIQCLTRELEQVKQGQREGSAQLTALLKKLVRGGVLVLSCNAWCVRSCREAPRIQSRDS